MTNLQLILFIVVFFAVWVFVVVLKIRSLPQLKHFIIAVSPAGKARVLAEYIRVLQQHSSFFNNLSDPGKKNFVARCSGFIMNKRFIGMEGLVITHEIRIRIAATAVQVTYGLKNSAFSHYHTVKVFPESFYSRMHDNYLKGGASTGGVLYFSWKDFEHGFSDPSDRYNLGLHEMAHALRLQLKHGQEFDERFASYTDHWFEMALPEFERMNQGKTSFLREYGATNLEEFFAVCVEHFFEVPVEFEQQLPDIFNHLCFLLNLDPTRIHDDYRLEPGFVESVNKDASRMPLPLKLSRAYQYETWHWSFNIIIAGLFAGIPAIFIFHSYVLYTGMQIFLIFVTVTALTMFFRNFFAAHGMALYHHLLLFCIAGLGPLITTGFLASNYFIKSSYDCVAYRVTHIKREIRQEGELLQNYFVMSLENQAYRNFKEIRTVPSETIQRADLNGTIYLAVTTSQGIWGLENFEDKAVIFFENPGKPD